MSTSNNERPDLIIAVPFFNEEARLKGFLDSIFISQKSQKVLLVMANHQSSDKSVEVASLYKDKFAKLEILEETSPLKCGGIPRHTALEAAINVADTYQTTYGLEIPIATIDCDVKVSDSFISDIIRFLNYGYDVVTFPERYDESELLKWAESQDQQTINQATRALIGLNYIRYDFLWALILSGIIETRGPGGYAMFAKTWKKLDHKQPLDQGGNPVTGENNQLGIRANRLGLKVISSVHHNIVHPRREFKSALGGQTKGYSTSSSGSEIFALARETVEMPILSESEWVNYLTTGIKRAIRMVLIRAVAFDKVDQLEWWFKSNYTWKKLLDTVNDLIIDKKYERKELDIVGSWVYKEIFREAELSLDDNEMLSLVGQIDSGIPTINELRQWANDGRTILPPSDKIITSLESKFREYYDKSD